MRFWRPGGWPLAWRAPIIGAAVAALTAVAVSVLPASFIATSHERTIDTLLTLAARLRPAVPVNTKVVVVDIDRRSLATIDPWPWPRHRFAELLNAATRSGASTVAIDILFEGADAKSPATLARRLGARTGRSDIVTWGDTLEDGDRLLADALDDLPVSLGFALDPNAATEVPAVPFLTSGSVTLPGIWRTKGAIAPFAPLLEHVAGVGTLALAGDEDGVVRRVPLLVGIGSRVHPGLAAEAVRLAEGASAYRIDGKAETIAIGGVTVRLPPDGMLRLVPDRFQVTTISAAELLAGNGPDPRLRDAIVLIGGSAPELGGLRPAAGDPLTPSVMLQAAAVSQLQRGIVPLPVRHGLALQALLGLIAVGSGLLAAVRLRPVPGALAIAGLSVARFVMVPPRCAAAHDYRNCSIRSPPIILGAILFATTALVTAAEMCSFGRRASGNASPSTPGAGSGRTDRGKSFGAQVGRRAARNHRVVHRCRGLHGDDPPRRSGGSGPHAGWLLRRGNEHHHRSRRHDR